MDGEAGFRKERRALCSLLLFPPLTLFSLSAASSQASSLIASCEWEKRGA